MFGLDMDVKLHMDLRSWGLFLICGNTLKIEKLRAFKYLLA